MRIRLAFIVALAFVVPVRAATTFPASTNANQTFFGANTFAQPITSSSLTADTVLVGGGFKAITSFPNGTGAFTNNSLGDFGWFNGFAGKSDLNSASNTLYNLITTSTNSQSLSVTSITTGTITVTNGITNLSLTANTVLKSDANKQIVNIANGTGGLTNNGSGTFGWFTFAAASDILNYSNNVNTVINSTSNSILSQMTNTVNNTSNALLSQITGSQTPWTTNINGNHFSLYNATNVSVMDTVLAGMLRATNGGTNWLGGISTIDGNVIYQTNTFTMAADFSKGTGRIMTNASFVFLSPLNVDKNKDQTTVMTVQNTLGSPILATAPANVFVVPGSVMWITNITKFTWSQDGFDTNLYAVPTR